MMMKGFGIEENMLNLTSASGGVRTSSGSRVKTGTLYTQNSFNSSINEAPPSKKKRSLPGNLDPDAEVIALSPKSLKDTNRFICEICNKGFRRDQNLQLHRRGHNLPWKLKQSEKKVERKKVYVCPEPTCGHHDPSRALGDLTGIKKHFSRKHGEKNWKCEKCSKKYAVQSDWKAHSKICGTREYKCDCGKIFSRRDSFITHRAFCDVLAEDSARAITANPLFSSQQQQNSSATHMFNFPPQLQSQGLLALQVKRELEGQHHIFNNSTRPDSNTNIPPWLACSSIDISSQLFSGNSFSQSLVHNGNPSPSPSSNPNSSSFAQFEPPTTTSSPHTLLQKAAHMGATMSIPSALPASMLRAVTHQTHHMSENVTTGSTSTAGAGSSGLGLSSREELASGTFIQNLSSFGNKAAASAVAATSAYMEQIAVSTTAGSGAAPSLLHDMMMSSFSSANGFDGSSSSFDEAWNGMLNPKAYSSNFQETQLLSIGNVEIRGNGAGSNNVGGNDGLTRDFLGLKTFPQRDFINIAGLEHINPSSSSSSTYGQQNQNPRPWQS